MVGEHLGHYTTLDKAGQAETGEDFPAVNGTCHGKATLRRLHLAVFAFGLLGLSLTCQVGASEKGYMATCVEVPDGDGFMVRRGKQTVRIRLFGIDSPEGRQAFGSEAQQFTSSLVLGKEVRIEPQYTDKYGRTVARVFAGRTDISKALLEAGLAWYANQNTSELNYAEAEKKAREAGIGVWSTPNPAPPWAWEDDRSFKYAAQDWAWFLPGNQVLEFANGVSQAQLSALSYLPILSRDGPWAEVIYRDQPGWVASLWEPPHDRNQAQGGVPRQLDKATQENYWKHLRAAQKILGIEETAIKVGAYKLFTDVEDAELLGFLDDVVFAAEDAYYARYARLPSGDPARSIVLFAWEADYRRYSKRTSGEPANTPTSGHSNQGLPVFYVEGHPRTVLAKTLVHNIAHLLNDRSFARSLPVWLEEGIAGDLGSVWVENTPYVKGDPRVGPTGATTRGYESGILVLNNLLGAGQLPPLRHLMGLDRETVSGQDVKEHYYSQSAAVVRYLLNGEQGKLADEFRAFLGQIAWGREADLLGLLGKDMEELDRGFRHWLLEEKQIIMNRLALRAEVHRQQ